MVWFKRFLLFSGDALAPKGGWDDFKGSFDTLDEAREGVSKTFHDQGDSDVMPWYQIVDTQEAGFIEDGRA